MRRAAGALLLLLALRPPLGGEAPPGFLSPALDRAIEAAYRADPPEQVLALLDRAEQIPPGTPAAAASWIRIEGLCYRALQRQRSDREEEAEELLVRAVALSDRALENHPEEGALYAQAAQLRSFRMMYLGLRGVIRAGREVEELARAALERNPRSRRAARILAQGLLYKPALFGGDPSEALQSLLALEASARETRDRFDAALAVALALEKLDRYDEALSRCRRALALYPRNRMALAVEARLKERL